jgi:RNAse (barnase) inhibitor barstar
MCCQSNLNLVEQVISFAILELRDIFINDFLKYFCTCCEKSDDIYDDFWMLMSDEIALPLNFQCQKHLQNVFLHLHTYGGYLLVLLLIVIKRFQFI